MHEELKNLIDSEKLYRGGISDAVIDIIAKENLKLTFNKLDNKPNTLKSFLGHDFRLICERRDVDDKVSFLISEDGMDNLKFRLRKAKISRL